MERREDGSGVRVGWGGVFRMETDLDSEQKTRRGGMNINTIQCRKIVTMDIIGRRREATGSKFLGLTSPTSVYA